MTIRDTMFRQAPELITSDVTELARIDLFIADAISDEPTDSSDRRYERAVALRAAALITDANPERISPTGLIKESERTSLGSVDYVVPSTTAKDSSTTNKYWTQYKRLIGLSGRSTPFLAMG